MRIEEDKEIDRPVAPIFAIIAFRLARLGRDRLAHLADKLMRAFVKAHDGALWVMPFGIEVEHVFHPGDIGAIDLRDAPHVTAPGLEIVLGQAPADGLARQAVMLGELDHLARQEFQRPALASRGRGGAGGRDQKRLLLAGELASPARAVLLVERSFLIAFHKAALGPINRRAANPNAPDDRLIVHARIGRQENLRPFQLANRMLAASQQRHECRAFRLAQLDPIPYIHHSSPIAEGSDESTRH